MRVARPLQVILLLLLTVVLIVGVTLRKYAILYFSRKPAVRPPATDLLKDPVASKDPKILLDEANRLAALSNWHRSLPLYQSAEKLFVLEGDKRDESFAHAGRIRAEGESGSYIDASRELSKLL